MFSRALKHQLKLLIENAKLASGNKEKGDSWSQNHGYVVGRVTGAAGTDKLSYYTVCHPTYDKAGELMGYPTFRYGRSSDLSRHIAGCSPAMVIMMATELLERRAAVGIDIDKVVNAVLKQFDMDRVAYFDDEERPNRHVAPLTKIIEEALADAQAK